MLRRHLKLFAIFLIIFITATGLSLSLFFTFNKFERILKGEFVVSSSHANISKIELVNNINFGHIEFKQMQKDSNDLFNARWTIIYQNQGLFSPDRFKNVVTNQTEEDILKVNFNLENTQNIEPENIISWNISVLFNPSLDLVNLSCNVGESNLAFCTK